MQILILVITLSAMFLMARMTFVMAKYNNRNPWLWALLTMFFGAFSMAYVFWFPKKRSNKLIPEHGLELFNND